MRKSTSSTKNYLFGTSIFLYCGSITTQLPIAGLPDTRELSCVAALIPQPTQPKSNNSHTPIHRLHFMLLSPNTSSQSPKPFSRCLQGWKIKMNKHISKRCLFHRGCNLMSHFGNFVPKYFSFFISIFEGTLFKKTFYTKLFYCLKYVAILPMLLYTY